MDSDPNALIAELRQQLAAAIAEAQAAELLAADRLAERDREAKDAGRYRFLRDTTGDDLDHPFAACDHGPFKDKWLTGEHLDAAIDTAIALAAGGERES